jgi:hypothetical protein
MTNDKEEAYLKDAAGLLLSTFVLDMAVKQQVSGVE